VLPRLACSFSPLVGAEPHGLRSPEALRARDEARPFGDSGTERLTTEARRVKNGGGCGHLAPTSRRVGTNDPNVVFWEAEEPGSVYSCCTDRSVSCASPSLGSQN